jgi:two-component system chemotaxis response regulator CheY
VARILVADDAAFVRQWCRATLTRRGHEVIEAGDGADAVRLFRDQRPDVILLDILMPGSDGLSTLREIRAIDPDARVAMLTTEGHEDVEEEARQAGARAFVVKPGTADRLLEAVAAALG